MFSCEAISEDYISSASSSRRYAGATRTAKDKTPNDAALCGCIPGMRSAASLSFTGSLISLRIGGEIAKENLLRRGTLGAPITLGGRRADPPAAGVLRRDRVIDPAREAMKARAVPSLRRA